MTQTEIEIDPGVDLVQLPWAVALWPSAAWVAILWIVWMPPNHGVECHGYVIQVPRKLEHNPCLFYT